MLDRISCYFGSDLKGLCCTCNELKAFHASTPIPLYSLTRLQKRKAPRRSIHRAKPSIYVLVGETKSTFFVQSPEIRNFHQPTQYSQTSPSALNDHTS